MGTPNQKKLATIKSSVLLPVQDTDEPYGEQLKYLPVTDIVQGGTAGNVVTTLAAFRASNDIPTNRIVTTTDFGGGSWYYVGLGDGVEVDNTANVIITADNRVWKRMPNEIVNVRNFGAKGDGVTDDAAAINTAIAYAKKLRNNSTLVFRGTTIQVLFPAGQYYISAPIYGFVGIDLIGESQNTTLIIAKSKFIPAIIFQETGLTDDYLYIFTRVANLSILGGSYMENPFAFKDNTISYVGSNGVEIHNHRVFIDHCTFSGWNECAIISVSVYYIYVSYCLLMNSRLGFHITATSTSNYLTHSEVRLNAIGVLIDNNSFGNYINNNTIESNIANFLDPEPPEGLMLSKGKAIVLTVSSFNSVYGNYIENHTSTFVISNSAANSFNDNIIVPALNNSTTDHICDIVTYFFAPVGSNMFINNKINPYDVTKPYNIRIYDGSQDYSSEFYSFGNAFFPKFITDNIAKWETQFAAERYKAPTISNISSGVTYRGLRPAIPFTLDGDKAFQGAIGVNLLPGEIPITPLNVRAANGIYLGVRAGQLDAAALQFNAFNTGGAANIPVEVKATKFELNIAGASAFKVNPDLSAEFTLTVKGQDGADPAHFVTNAKFETKKAATNADVASANATDLATALTLVNELKTQVNSLQAKLRTATLLTT